MGSPTLSPNPSTSVHRQTTTTRRAPWWRSRTLKGIGYAAPTAVVVVTLFLFPLVLMVWMSFNHWPLLGKHAVNGLTNYRAVANNDLIRQAVVFTLRYTLVITVVLFVCAFSFALLVQEKRRGVGLIRTAIFLPGTLGLASASLLFLGMFNNEIGPLTPMLRTLGIVHGPMSWLGTPNMALLSACLLIVWRFAGLNMLILLVGLQAIPGELYEAARMDGARRAQILRSITIPLMRRSIAIVLILMITGSLLAFDQFYILTAGGPDNSTISIVMVIYREAFTRLNLGTAAALSVLVLLAVLVVNAVQFRGLRRDED